MKNPLRKFVLGSGSSSRKEILDRLHMDYIVVKGDLNEKNIGKRTHSDDASDLVLELGHAKADNILGQLSPSLKDRILITADQVVTHCGHILEKPESVEEARRYIKGYGESPCSTVGSIVLTDIATNIRVSGIDCATMEFSSISDHAIDQIISEGDVMYCAGALMIEHPLMQACLTSLNGSEDSVKGLSVSLLQTLLEKLENEIQQMT